ncbi:MAG: hypothetical protein M1832_001352 [Thelocarpon impressellum]|nr:MAG: hypothetical protein M1832_001352 [Thelocarpon impressellum]
MLRNVTWDPVRDHELMDFDEDGSPHLDDLDFLGTYRKVLIARGPYLLLRLMDVLSDAERENLIKHKLDMQGGQGISEPLRLLPGYAVRTPLTPDPDRDHYRMKDEVTFVADDGKGPNQAWVWANEGRALPARSGQQTRGLRQWGYVMWDKRRLNRWSDEARRIPARWKGGDIEAAIRDWFVEESELFGHYCIPPFGVEGGV